MSDRSFAIPTGVLVAHLQGEAVILHTVTKRYYRLNDTAAVIWRGLERQEPVFGIVEQICQEFDITRDKATPEVERVLSELLGQGLLESRPAAG